MRRCFDLARLGAGKVSPNPMVGAVLVYEGRIIGEGWHRKYGQAHAEVNAVGSVHPADRDKIPKATLYVSLEPCCIHGNTPACTDLIRREGIRKVVFSCLDQTPGVAGQGVQILRDSGVEVITGVLEETGKRLSDFRNLYVTKHRPYVVLKWAQSADGFMGQAGKQIWLSHPASRRLVHKWRSELDAILVGAQTALTDNPQLNARLYFGRDPIRIALDRRGRFPSTLHLLDDSQPTRIFGSPSTSQQPAWKQTQWISVDPAFSTSDLLSYLATEKVTSLLVEGGSAILDSFVKANLWDEARVLTSACWLGSGIRPPEIAGEVQKQEQVGTDRLTVCFPKETGR